MKRRRVKITGIGPVTPAGIGTERFWKGILEPVSRVQPYPHVGEEFGPLVAAFLADFDVRDYVPHGSVPRHLARHTNFALAGMMLALQDAGLRPVDVQRLPAAIVTGSSLVDFGGIVKSMDQVGKLGARGAMPRLIFNGALTNVPEMMNEVLGTSARTMVVQTSCCAGLDAVGYAARMVADRETEIAICGGTEAPLSRCPLLELRAAGLTPTTTEMPGRLSRPFDLWRTTGVVSEGACIFILEPESSPRPGYAYVSGWATANDPAGTVCSGMVESSLGALADAGLRPNEIDHISAWAPGHKEIDRGEAQAMERVFGARLPEIGVTSIKGALGAPLGAAPALQIAAMALGKQREQIPPTVNWEFPDPDCNLNLSNQPRHLASRAGLINAHGVGKINSSLILQKC